MGGTTGISWCHHTFNPWWGCVEVSPECDRCYARVFSERLGRASWGKDTARLFFGDRHWAEPLAWDRAARKAGERRRVFCASMADVCEEREDLEPHRIRLWSLIRETQHLDWLLLTKRAGAMARLVPAWIRALPNVWPGVTCGDPSSLWRVEKLVALECAGPRWVSAEPLLGPLDFRRWLRSRTGDPITRSFAPGAWLSWLVVGGESGKGHRPMELAWVEYLAQQCAPGATALFVKQDSGLHPGQQGRLRDALWMRKELPAFSRCGTPPQQPFVRDS